MFAQQDQKKGAKKAFNPKSGTERRMRDSIQVRQRAHIDRIKQVRGESDAAMSPNVEMGMHQGITGSMNPMDYNSKTPPIAIPVALLPTFVEMMASNDAASVFHGTQMVRKLLSVENDPPIDYVIASGAVPHLSRFLTIEENRELQFEAAWALTNITSGTREHAQVVIESNAVPHFINLLRSPSAECREQATWALGNLAGEGGKCRDFLITLNVLDPLLTLLTTDGEALPVMRNAAWTLSNLCRSKPLPNLEILRVALPVLAHLLNYPDDEVVSDSAWAISYISDGPNERIQAVLEANVLMRIVELLGAPSTTLQTPAIRTIGNIATGNEEQTQTIINAGALSKMIPLLQSPKRAIRKETCWTVSNVAAGSDMQIAALVESNVFPAVIQCLKSVELDVKKEAAWAVSNLCSGTSGAHVPYIVMQGVIPPLCEVLSIYDPKIVCVALEALDNILRVGEVIKNQQGVEVNEYALEVDRCGGVLRIDELQQHSHEDVYKLALNILESYFGGETIDDVVGGDIGANMNFGGFDNSDMSGGQANFNF